jgi:diacylglycerol kinase family enzyme/membrane-associated phospholipid phosphatase
MPEPRRTLAKRREAADRWVHQQVIGYKPTGLDVPLTRLSHFADHGKLWFALAGGLAVTGPAGRRAAVRGVISLGLASAAANLVGKSLFGGPRPDLNTVPLIRRLRRTPTSGSFPSGHTASATAFALAVTTEKPLLGAAVLPLAGAVAYSRVHTGAHWFSDVLGGVVIGAGAVALTTAVTPPDWLRRKIDGPPGDSIDLPALGDGHGLVVIVNPHSGEGVERRADPLAAVRRALPAATIRVLGGGDELVQMFEDAARDAKAIGACGGDGTIALAAKTAARHGVPLLVLPGGTFNHFARAVGADDVPATLRAAREGRGVAVDVATATLGDREPWTVLNTASVGLYPEMVLTREKWRDRIGKPLAGAVASLRVLRDADPIEATGERGLHHQLWTMFVGVNKYRPRTSAPLDRARLDDGVLDVRILRSVAGRSRWHPLIGDLIGGILGGRLRRRRADLWDPTTEFAMSSLPDVSATFYPNDGELLFAHDGEVEKVPAGPDGVELTMTIVPQPLWVYRN